MEITIKDNLKELTYDEYCNLKPGTLIYVRDNEDDGEERIVGALKIPKETFEYFQRVTGMKVYLFN